MLDAYYIDDPHLWWASPFRTTMPPYDTSTYSGTGVADDFGNVVQVSSTRWYSLNS